MKSLGKCSYMWSCGMTFPSSWLADHCKDCYQPQGFHILGEEIIDDGYRSRKWRDLLKSLLQREGRRLRRKKKSFHLCCHSPKTTKFGYDAVSYSKNFDDGLRLHQDYYYSSATTASSSSIKHDDDAC